VQTRPTKPTPLGSTIRATFQQTRDATPTPAMPSTKPMKIVFLLPGPPSSAARHLGPLVEQFLRPPGPPITEAGLPAANDLQLPVAGAPPLPTTMPYSDDRNLTLEIKALLFISLWKCSKASAGVTWGPGPGSCVTSVAPDGHRITTNAFPRARS